MKKETGWNKNLSEILSGLVYRSRTPALYIYGSTRYQYTEDFLHSTLYYIHLDKNFNRVL